MDRHVRAVGGALHAAAVERAGAVGRGGATARRALVALMARALAQEQELDASVGRGLERLLPAGGGAPLGGRLLAPSRQLRALAQHPRLAEQGRRDVVELGRPRVGLGVGAAHHGSARLGRKQLDEPGARLVRAHDDDVGRAAAPHLRRERLGDILQVLSRVLVDVALIVRLRPAALVGPPQRLLLRQVGELEELA